MNDKKPKLKSVKVETINHKKFYVGREKGIILAKRRVTKDFSLEQAKRIFRANRTFDKNIERERLKTRKNIERFSITPSREGKRKVLRKPDKKVAFQGVTVGLLKDGSKLGASSQFEFWDSAQEAIDTSDMKFYAILANHFNMGYDAGEGLKIIKSEVVSLKHSIVYYV